MSCKIIKTEEFPIIRKKLREEGRKVVQCHGVFDLIHPGHIQHLEEAKALGDILVVTITSKPFVNKGPGRPFFSDELRMKTIAALECVDYVLLSENVTSIEIISKVQPDLYIKGMEFARSEDDVTQNIDKEAEAVKQYGGKVHFTSDQIVFSSTSILNNYFELLPVGVKDYSKDLLEKYDFNQLKEIVEEFKNLRILVVGDIIIDEYVFCNVMGLMSKDRGYSVKYIGEESYLGGALAVARHLNSFSDNITVCSILGKETHIHSKILDELSKSMLLDVCIDENYKTITKKRFIQKNGLRDEYEKIFSVNDMMLDTELQNINRKPFYKKLRTVIANYDMVMISDFGHGLMDQTAMDIVQEKAGFLALNCQTNSTNYGTNIITKYKKADMFALDERELSLAFSTSSKNYTDLLYKMKNYLNSCSGWLTMGSSGAMGIDSRNKTVGCPALTLSVKDTIGAGDAFFAISGLSAKMGLPIEIGTFFGNIAGALASNTLGNSKPVIKVDFLKFMSTLLKVQIM